MFKTQDELKEYLEDRYPGEEIVVFENPSYHTAFVGVSHDMRAIYDYNKMVEFLISIWDDDGKELDYVVAMEFIDYNTIRSLGYVSNSPIVMYVEEYNDELE